MKNFIAINTFIKYKTPSTTLCNLQLISSLLGQLIQATETKIQTQQERKKNSLKNRLIEKEQIYEEKKKDTTKKGRNENEN